MAGSPWQPGDGPLRLPPPEAEGWSEADREETVDVVIVGGGPGGSAVARILSLAGARVLLLEEGPPRSRFGRSQGGTMRHHMQEGGAMVALGTGPLPIAAGRGLGGGSLINSAIAWRAPDDVLDGWTQLLGDDRHSAASLKPIYDELWELLGIGPPSYPGVNNDLLVRGAKACGFPGGYLDRYTPGCTGCGVCYLGCPSGGKSSVNLNLLAEAASFGTRILADTRVEGLLLDDRERVVGVTGRMMDPDSRRWGGRVTVHAERVVLTAGAIGTPRLLHHAGLAGRLGPVGEGLHVHPGSAVLGWCPFPVNLWRGATQAAWFTHPELPGVLPHSFSATPETCLLVSGRYGRSAEPGIEELSRLCGAVVMISDKGTGRVGAWSDGRADLSYRFDPDDVSRIKAGMYRVAQVLLAGGAETLTAPVRGVERCSTADALAAQLADKTMADFTLYASHPMSSCRMGRNPETSVLGPDGQSHKLKGLYFADASIFPTSLGVNPSLTVMAMATRIARDMVTSTPR